MGLGKAFDGVGANGKDVEQDVLDAQGAEVVGELAIGGKAVGGLCGGVVHERLSHFGFYLFDGA